MGDVAGSSHPPGGHRGEVGPPGLVGDAGVTLHRDEARGDRVHDDAERGQLAGPGASQPDLRALGGGVGGPARWRPAGDLGVDLHDTAVAPGLHPGQYGPAEQHRALDEEVQLGQVVSPGHVGHRGFGLGAGGVDHQHVNRAERVSYRGSQPGDLVLVGDIGAEALGGAPVVTDGAADGGYLLVAGQAIDRDRKAVTRQAPRDHRPQSPRAARHQSNTSVRHRHMVIIPRRPAPGGYNRRPPPPCPAPDRALHRGPRDGLPADRAARGGQQHSGRP
jgi:hypothetical protein